MLLRNHATIYYNLVRRHIIQSQASENFPLVLLSHWEPWTNLQRTNWKHTFTRLLKRNHKGQLGQDGELPPQTRTAADPDLLQPERAPCVSSPARPCRCGAVLPGCAPWSGHRGHYWGCQGREGAGSQSRVRFRDETLTWLTEAGRPQARNCGARQHTATPACGRGGRRCRARTVQGLQARAAAHTAHAQPARGMGKVGAGHSPSSVTAGPNLPSARTRHVPLDAGT